jgi:putative ABC transport system permease protein
MTMLTQHLRMSFAILLRRKFLTFVNLFGTVLTLTVLVVAVAVLDSMLHPPGAQHRQNHILIVDRLTLKGKSAGGTSNPGLAFFRRHIAPLETPDLISYATTPAVVTSYVDNRKLAPQVRRTDAAYWKMLDFDLRAGRTIGNDDVKQGRRVAVINEAMAESFFPDQRSLGQLITLDAQTFEVIGVVANEPETSDLAYADVWVPYTAIEINAYDEQWGADGVIMLYVDDCSKQAAVQAELAGSLEQFVYTPDPERFDTATARAETTLDRIANRIMGEAENGGSQTSRFLGGALLLVLLFMLLPALNMTNLNIGRILERVSEIGLRKATGATVRALVAQFMFENIVLTLVGGVVALAVAPLFLGVLNRNVFSYGTLHLNLTVLFAGLVFAMIFGVLSGAYPAWRMATLEPATALRGRGHA